MGDIPLRRTEGLLDYTVHVHVRNASLGKMQDTMANGNMDIEWLVSALKAHGYEGALSIEYFRDFDSDFVSTLALQRLLVELGVEL
jgi:sugar phosphate isomerase/epimerase